MFDNYILIYLTKRNGKTFECYIDKEDFNKVSVYDLSWVASWYESPKCYYATATQRYRGSDGKMHGRTIMMHRVVTNTQGFKHVVDHIDHDGLNNRQYNLRVTITEKNTKHREHKNSNNKSGYRNVFWNSKDNKWCVTLCKNYKRIHIGEFDDVDVAGKVAEQAREKYYGEFAGSN